MKVTINNVDYSAALDSVHPLTVERKLNEPTVCLLWVTLGQASALAAPQRNQPVVVEGDDGTVYFTGYLAVAPLPEFAGVGTAGPIYRWALQAVSDELLLNMQPLTPSAGMTGVTAAVAMQTLTAHAGGSGLGAAVPLDTSGLGAAAMELPVGNFVPEYGWNWSQAAGMVAAQARASYRAVGGRVTAEPVGTTVHVLDESKGTLVLSNLAMTASVERALANDVTVCGGSEPWAYVTEYLLGDGVTATFALSQDPFFETSAETKIINNELFNEPVIDTRKWMFTGASEYFSLTGAGLTWNGGTGSDGQTALVWRDAVEAGGSLLLELHGVQLSPGSSGIVGGLYGSGITMGGCVAGFEVSAAQGTGAVTVAPVVNGVVAGPSYAVDPTVQYTLRVRVHCPLTERVTQVYRVVGDAGAMSFGGQDQLAGAQVVLELMPVVNGIAGTTVTLYDGMVTNTPVSYQVGVANSWNLIGSVRSVSMTNLGSGWVRSMPPGQGTRTRRTGTIAEGGECHLLRTGTITFYKGYIPVLGELVEVHYRTVGTAVGRWVNAASQAALQAVGMPATAQWIGSVTQPKARSSADCRNAAEALGTAASSVSAAWQGTYKVASANWATGLTSDVWPGDELLLTAPSAQLNEQVAVRMVKLTYKPGTPDVVNYQISFANDWANDLAVKTSKTVPVTTWLPAAIAPVYLEDVTTLTVTAIGAATLTVNAGVAPPAGGGFEVRRRDFSFQAGVDADLVIRSTVETFEIPRVTESDAFYIRMYDGSTPPNYSEHSVALMVNLPLVAQAV